LDNAAISHVATLVQKAIDPPGSIHANKGFQRHLAGVLVERGLRIALERAHHG
jgi:CO/xanthine dehydrogenase FAD-binding subunit